MNKIKEDELDAFLWEVETVSKQVKDILEGKADADKLIEKERIKKEKKEKEEELRKLKEEEEKRKIEENLRNGVKGKGEKDNYKKFCKGCFIEYQIDTIDKCTHCKYDLITREIRHAELREKLEQLKEKKAKKMIRKQKYENWLKTESIFKTSKVNFQNYHKWDLYESSTDEDEKGEPVLPRHDPNFLAMEKDLMETEKKREISRNKSLKLKDDGNKMMKEGKYKKAVKLYSEAIEETRSMMILYTNRALAYFKLEDYQNSIADCDRVIEYLEIFEDQLEKNKETYAKAISRKALCCQKMKNYEVAKTLIAKAYEYVKDDEIVKLQKNILMEEEVHLKALSLITGDSEDFEEINKFINCLQNNLISNKESINKTTHSDKETDVNYTNTQNLSHDSIQKIVNILEKNENNRLFLIQKGGLDILFTKSVLIENISLIELIEVFHHKRDDINERNKYMLLINNIKGYNKLINLLFNQSEAPANKFDYKYIKSIVSILEDASHVEEVRKTLHDLKEIDKLFIAAVTQYDISDESMINDENVVIIIMHLFTFIGNLCYSGQEIRQKISTNYFLILEKTNKFIDNFKLEYVLHRNIMETVLSFLINLSCDEKFRDNLARETKFINFIISDLMKRITISLDNVKKFNTNNYDDLYEKVSSLIYNLSFNNYFNTSSKSSASVELFVDLGIVEIIQKFMTQIFNMKFDLCSESSVLRTLMLTAKITKNQKSSILFNTEFYNLIIAVTNFQFLGRDPKFVDNGIKILAHLLQNKKSDENKFSRHELNLKILCENLREIFLADYPKLNIDKEKERIINNMSLMISLIGYYPELSECFRNIIKNIIEIAKDKTDLLRKNAAILLAKIAKSSKAMESYVRELHGMDVLMNVAKFIQINK